MKVYLDNAATTPLDNEVIAAMIPVMEEGYVTLPLFMLLEEKLDLE